MGKTLKQSTAKSYRQKTADSSAGKVTGKDYYGNYITPMNYRVKDILGRSHKSAPVQYFIVRVNPNLEITAAESEHSPKVNLAKALFSKK